MRTWLAKVEAMAAAVAFAEHGEWNVAQSIVDGSDRELTQRMRPTVPKKDQRTRVPGNYRV